MTSELPAVIVSGDDFGLAPAIDDGILEAHEHGCLTSASLSVVGPTAEEAVAAARRFPDLGVGLHLTLVDERPLSDPGEIPSLVQEDGRFMASGTALALRWWSGRVNAPEARHEIRAQLARCRDLGLRITHLDSHDHVHVLPGLLEIALDEMARFNVRRLRMPLETRAVGAASLPRRAAGWGLNLLARRAARVARKRGFTYPDRYLGYRGAGAIDTASLHARIESIGEGVTELGLHPATGTDPPREDFAAWGYRWHEELAALVDPGIRKALVRRGLRLINFGHLEVS